MLLAENLIVLTESYMLFRQSSVLLGRNPVLLPENLGLPFLDKWHLIPGDPWQEALEEALDASRTCAVFLRPNTR
jgi:hypothetical protein